MSHIFNKLKQELNKQAYNEIELQVKNAIVTTLVKLKRTTDPRLAEYFLEVLDDFNQSIENRNKRVTRSNGEITPITRLLKMPGATVFMPRKNNTRSNAGVRIIVPVKNESTKKTQYRVYAPIKKASMTESNVVKCSISIISCYGKR